MGYYDSIELAGTVGICVADADGRIGDTCVPPHPGLVFTSDAYTDLVATRISVIPAGLDAFRKSIAMEVIGEWVELSECRVNDFIDTWHRTHDEYLAVFMDRVWLEDVSVHRTADFIVVIQPPECNGKPEIAGYELAENTETREATWNVFRPRKRSIDTRSDVDEAISELEKQMNDETDTTGIAEELVAEYDEYRDEGDDVIDDYGASDILRITGILDETVTTVNAVARKLNETQEMVGSLDKDVKSARNGIDDMTTAVNSRLNEQRTWHDGRSSVTEEMVRGLLVQFGSLVERTAGYKKWCIVCTTVSAIMLATVIALSIMLYIATRL